MANEYIDAVMKKKETGILCKIDMEKAYNGVN